MVREVAADRSEVDALVAIGRLPDALALATEHLARYPDSAESRLCRADVLQAWGRIREARKELLAASGSRAGSAELSRRLGEIAREDGRLDVAEQWLARALERAPHDTSIDLALAALREAQGRAQDAISLYAQAARAPDDELAARALLGQIRCETALGRSPGVLELARFATARLPDCAAAWDAYGVALATAGCQSEAFAAFERSESAGAQTGEPVEAYANLGIGLCGAGRHDEGIRVLLEGVRERPNANALLQLAAEWLRLGRFRSGWRLYEHRWFVEALAPLRADYPLPVWNGQEARDATILVRAEQGIGDTFQFARYLRELRILGARVLFQPLQSLVALADRFEGVHEVVEPGRSLDGVDYAVNLMSLPLAFGTRLDSIPSADPPYFVPDRNRVSHWRARLRNGARNGRKVVGLVWAGRPGHARDRERSIALERLAPILATPGVRFVSLQQGAALRQAEALPEELDWESVGPALHDLDEAAAAIANLDLIVCVDTGLAHVAGAIGVPAWVLIPEPADFRWLVEREDSPWYPSMRLFRQRTRGDWDEVVARLAHSLAHWSVAESADADPRPARTSAGFAETNAVRPADDIAHLPFAVQTRLGFVRMDPDAGDEGRSLEYYGEWLEGRGAYVRKLVRRGDVVVEAGTGAGVCALETARMLGPEGELLVYERSAALRGLLARNLEACGIRQVTLMSRELVGRGGFTKERERLDDLGLERLDGLKVNEGWDAEAVVEGAEQTLWRCRPWMVMAVDGEEAMSRLAERIRGYGYRTWRMEWPLFSADNFNRRYVDLFDGRAALALIALPEEEQQRTIPGESILLT